jgi:hypothetical protein
MTFVFKHPKKYIKPTKEKKTGVVYNTAPDPVTKITEFEIDKPVEGKTYALTGTKDDKCISNGNTWKESEVKEDK